MKVARSSKPLMGHLSAQSCHGVPEQRYRIDVEPFREAKYREGRWRPQPAFEKRVKTRTSTPANFVSSAWFTEAGFPTRRVENRSLPFPPHLSSFHYRTLMRVSQLTSP